MVYNCSRQNSQDHYNAQMATAGILLIGNEILSGKIQDQNGLFLTRELRELGVSLCRITILPDIQEEIAQAVSWFAKEYTWVFTSGGLGVTHDDVTIAAVAQAFSVPVFSHPDLHKQLLETAQQKEMSPKDAYLRLAYIPYGATLFPKEPNLWPAFSIQNVFVLPGIPSYFRRNFLAIKERFRESPFFLKELFMNEEEETIADQLTLVAAKFPQIFIGSYPQDLERKKGKDDSNNAEKSYKVKVTLEGKDPELVEKAYHELHLQLGLA